MVVRFDRLAAAEMEDASKYYECQLSGLGSQFKKEIKNRIRWISRHPMACPKETGDVRRCLLHRFPYKILFSIEKAHIYIVAVAHCHRNPDYWIDRILNEN
jgi:mRNA-degrading endonuclease RelE of RelBE toxin-antitoxin system